NGPGGDRQALWREVRLAFSARHPARSARSPRPPHGKPLQCPRQSTGYWQRREPPRVCPASKENVAPSTSSIVLAKRILGTPAAGRGTVQIRNSLALFSSKFNGSKSNGWNSADISGLGLF